jgi:hypothetical protein
VREAPVVALIGGLSPHLARATDHLQRDPDAGLVMTLGSAAADPRTGATLRAWVARHDTLLRGARGVALVASSTRARWIIRLDLVTDPPPGRWAVRASIEEARAWLDQLGGREDARDTPRRRC